MKRILLSLLALFLSPALAVAQSSPGLQYGQVPTAGQWNSYFSAKQDYNPNLLTGSGVSGHVAKWSGVPGLLQDGGILPTPANPIAAVGLTAVNGVAASYMRSDAAPAISQAIAPTWSGTHTFTLAPVFTAQAGTRTALGLGTSATVNTGTSGATIPLLNGSNTWAGAQTYSSTITPSGGVVGVTGASNASAGHVGQYISSSIPVGSAVSLTTGTAANITSISLTAGDWDVSGNVAFKGTSGYAPTVLTGWVSSTSATIPTAPNGGSYAQINAAFSTDVNAIHAFSVGVTRLSLASTTTVYLSGVVAYTGGTMTGYGFIGARRVR